MSLLLLRVVTWCRLVARYQRFGKERAGSIFSAAVATLGSGEIYIVRVTDQFLLVCLFSNPTQKSLHS
jgi:hypothetical protein